jgi:hypothetical protein
MPDGIPGMVNLVGTIPNSSTPTVFASMVLAPTNDNNTESPFVLDASNTNGTVAYLMMEPGSATPDGLNGSDVWLRFPVANSVDLIVEDYCATFDPNPPVPAPMVVNQCMPDLQNAHLSQRFLYTPLTGVLRPVYLSNTSVPIANISAPTLATDKRDLTGAPDTAPQNVTMVFTPMAQNILPANQFDASLASSSSPASFFTTSTTTATAAAVSSSDSTSESTSNVSSPGISSGVVSPAMAFTIAPTMESSVASTASPSMSSLATA